MTALSANDLAWFAARLSLAVYDTNRETPAMLIHEMREALKGLPGLEDLQITYQPDGNQLLNLDGKTLEVGPMASNEEIRLALLNPFIRTENTSMSITGANSLKAKFEAAKTRKAAIEARVDTALTAYNGAADIAESAIKSLEDDAAALQAEVKDFTNGSPA